MSKNTVDITPVGCQTPEGVERVTKTLQAWEDSRVEFANTAVQFFSEHRDYLTALLKAFGPVAAPVLADMKEVIALGRTMVSDQEEFLLAVAGRPSSKS
jgi:hypothetical protein